MTKPFKGTINIDIRDSVPDWEPYVQPKAPDGASNVLFVVWDDVGFAAMEPFGGLVKTPTVQRIADMGLRYTQFHTTALCSPTRASMLTGRNHTTVGMACICEGTTGFPGSNGHIPFETATIAEVLGERGYNTYMTGKWHCCPADETNMGSSKRNWPTGRGCERFYGFLGGETNQWYPDLVQDQQFVDQPSSPEEGYHLSKDLADKAISMIADAKQVAPDKPFFMYYCPGAGHAPHHVSKEWADKYKGVFDAGYEKYAEEALARMKKMGIMPENTDLAPMNSMADEKSVDGTPWPELDIVRPWDSLSDDEKVLFIRMAEVWAGFVSYTDHQIGRVIDYLEQIGQLDNTLIVVISDNGASGEGGPNGSVNENKFFNNIPDDIKDNLAMLDELGGPNTYNHYPNGWAQAFCAPFKMYKRYNWNGGICDPMIVSWPKGIKDQGGIRDQYCHVSDIVPTIYECLDLEPPEMVKGYTQWNLDGTSFKYTFDDAEVKTKKVTQYYTMLGSRGIYHDGWKANTIHPTIANWAHFSEDKWALYHVDEDRSEVHDLADKQPVKLAELQNLWYSEAGKYFGLPLDDRTALEIGITPRPQMVKPTDRYIYFPHTLEVPEAVAVSTRGRSFKFAAEVELKADAEGVIFAQGSMFGGYALYIKDGMLKYVYNYVGLDEQVIVSSEKLPTGKCVLGVAYDMEAIEETSATGTLSLYINEKKVGEKKIKTQLGGFALAGEGFNVGRDGGAPVTNDYPGVQPWAFSDGTIKQVVVDVSGEAYVDLEKEAIGMMKRD
ncbi:MAG: arylsulfatase [Anaerolineales bacterium]